MHWIETHGVEVIVGYILFAAFVGSMPPLPEGATFWQRWAYGFLHLASANLRQAAQILNIKLPNGNGKEHS